MNVWGRVFKITIFGESHGPYVGVVVDGVVPGLSIQEKDFHADIARRMPGQKGTTPRLEKDIPEIVSGIFEGKTTGAPLTILFRNENVQSKDYGLFKNWPRPGHADWVAHRKFFGYNDYRGGGHFSGRLTLPLVAAGVVAKKMLGKIKIGARIIEAGGDTNIERAIENAMREGDSVGGLIECEVKNVPAGLGEPFFDSLESLIAHAVFAIPAIKGIEFGSGFRAACMKGSEHNDVILNAKGKTLTNHAGGINGGISNGNPIVFRVAVKPTSSIAKPQHSYNLHSEQRETNVVKGRHDVCIALRAPVVIEAVTAITLADLLLIQKSREAVRKR